MKCKCGRMLEQDSNGVLYHSADLVWFEEPDMLDRGGEKVPLLGARPADPEGCQLLPYQGSLNKKDPYVEWAEDLDEDLRPLKKEERRSKKRHDKERTLSRKKQRNNKKTFLE